MLGKNKFRSDLAALTAYLVLTLVLTYPLLLHFTTHVAGDGSDDPALAWNLWWVPHALLDLGTSPIYTNYLFFPIGLNLGFYTLTYLNAFLAIPFQFTFGLIPAANLNLILSFTLSGFGAYLLARYLLRRAGFQWITPAAFVGGLLYAFSANKFLYASLGQFNIASSQWIPFYLFFLLKLLDSPTPPLRYGFLLGVLLLAQALSEFIFASFLILFTLVYLVYWRLAIQNSKFETLSRTNGRDRKSKIPALVLAVLVVVLTLSPILAAMLSDLWTEGDFIQQGLGFSNIFSADLLGFIVPSHLHPLFGALEAQFHFPYINFMYLGFVALALAVLALVKVRPARSWGVWFGLILLITLGPTLRINGAEWDLPLPFDLLLNIPLIKGNRYPSRWSVLLTLCLAVLVAYGTAWLLDRLARRQSTGAWRPVTLASVAIGALLLFEHLSVPLPLSNLQAPEIYSQIARDPGDWTVMELPLAWRNGFRVTGSYRSDSQGPIDRSFMLAQFYQATQQHPILNGNTSRNPELKFQYFAEAPVFTSLIAIQTGHEIDDATRTRDQQIAPRVLQFFGTRYILWHTPSEQANRDVANKTRAYVEQTFPVTKLSESYENGRGVVVYRVNTLPAPQVLVIKPGDPLARLYLGEGWGAVGGNSLIAQRGEAKLFVQVAEPHALQLTLVGLQIPPRQSLRVQVNGQDIPISTDSVPPDGNYRVTIPAAVLARGLNEITLEFGATFPPLLAATPMEIGKTGVATNNSIVVRSAGEEQGAFGHIYVNGKDESPNARGYNVVVLDARSGKVEASANFDTFASEAESARLAQYLARIPNGKLVAVAASDEASLHLTPEAVSALASLGAARDLRGKFRWSHAILGVKGAPPGSALEQSSETQVSQLIVGEPLTEPSAAAGMNELRIEPMP